MSEIDLVRDILQFVTQNNSSDYHHYYGFKELDTVSSLSHRYLQLGQARLVLYFFTGRDFVLVLYKREERPSLPRYQEQGISMAGLRQQ